MQVTFWLGSREAKIFFGSDSGRQKFFLARIQGGKNSFWLGFVFEFEFFLGKILGLGDGLGVRLGVGLGLGEG